MLCFRQTLQTEMHSIDMTLSDVQSNVSRTYASTQKTTEIIE
jgi:hypothetical protein